MKYRKNQKNLNDTLPIRKIIFLIGPRQVGKTTILKNTFDSLNTDKKLFLNLEILDYHEYFKDFSSIVNLLLKNGFEKDRLFYLFLDEFHKVKKIDWIIKSLFDEYENIRIILSGSNNIEINKNIKESFAGRKRVINMYPLDFEEFLIWKENLDQSKVSNFKTNPLNKQKILLYLEDFMTWGGYPEVVLQDDNKKKVQILQDIFSFWFNKDILIEIKENFKFNSFLKHLALKNGNLLNISEIASQIGVSKPTGDYYFDLMFKSLLIYPVKPFFSNKLKEIIKMPKFYFIDNGFRNYLINKFEFLNDEKGILFENFIYSEMIKKGINHENIKYWRTKNQVNEVDFILENENQAIEIKYKENIDKKDNRGLNVFLDEYKKFSGQIINKNNFIETLDLFQN